MESTVSRHKPSRAFPFAFFVLTFVLSVPFYVLTALASQRIGFRPEMVALFISLFTFAPVASASILTFKKDGWEGVKILLKRAFDFRRIAPKSWYAPILLLWPLVLLGVLGVIVLAGEPIRPALVPVVALPAILIFFFILACGEEIGWMGYAFERMQGRGSTLKASLVLGTIWALWHVPIFIFVMPEPVTVVAQVFTLIGVRVLVVWIFNNTGRSVFAAIVFHAADNAALVTFPDFQNSSPMGAIVPAGIFLALAIGVTMIWGPRTLAQPRFSKS